MIQDQIRESITNFEPRVRLRNVITKPDFDNNAFDVSIIYDIIGINVPAQELTFVLQQTR